MSMLRFGIALTLLAFFNAVLGRETEKIKKVEEIEYEIGYIQTLELKLPAVASVKSSFQEIEVYDSEHFGKVFLLDECLQLTEKDAPHYNEMLAHVPMMEYISENAPDEKMRVLVLGGGDGYVVSELLKYDMIEQIDHVELDAEVINVSEKFFPWASSAWSDSRVNLIITDGAAFVQEQLKKKSFYHVIIQDASDPFYTDDDGETVILPSNVLYEDSHFEAMYKLLEPTKGVLGFQAETYNIPSNLVEIRKWRESLDEIGFKKSRYGAISISTYPTGQIGFFVSHASGNNGDVNDENNDMVCKTPSCDDEELEEEDEFDDSMNKVELDWRKVWDEFRKFKESLKYYHPRIHRSAFDLPLWVESVIY